MNDKSSISKLDEQVISRTTIFKDYNYINWLKKIVKKEGGYFSTLSSHYSNFEYSELEKQNIGLLGVFFDGVEEYILNKLGYKIEDSSDRSYCIKYGKKIYAVGKEYIGGINNYYYKICDTLDEKRCIDFDNIVFYAALSPNSDIQKKLDKLECIVRDMIRVDKIPPIAILDIAQKYVKKEN